MVNEEDDALPPEDTVEEENTLRGDLRNARSSPAVCIVMHCIGVQHQQHNNMYHTHSRQ